MATAKKGHDRRDGAAWTPRQRVKNDVIHAVVRVALAVVLRLPQRVTRTLCQALGALAYCLLKRERALARARLAAGLGAPPSERRVRGAFVTAGATLADTLALFDPRERAGRTLSLSGGSREAFRDALAGGRGVVFVAAHLGSWERMAALLVEEGFPVATVARESYDPRFTLLYERIRAPRGVRSIYRGQAGAAMAIVRELRAGRAVGFLIDLPARRVQSAEVTLFGVASTMPVGAARIALARGAAVVVGTTAPGREVQIERVGTGDLSPGGEGERALMERIARILEGRIAAWPEGWLGLFAPTGVWVRSR